MLRFVPPAGAPLKVTQIFRALKATWTSHGQSGKALRALGERLQARHVFALSSGRAALWAILKALHHLRPDRNTVAVPAYVCFSVPASIVRAGLKVEPVDVNPETLDFDFSQLEALPGRNLLCVMASNLFGMVNDMPCIQAVARAKGAYVVDNAAQGLGALLSGRFVGTGGDVGLYSLGRGKAVTTLEGGIVVTSSEEIAGTLQAIVGGLQPRSPFHKVNLFLQMLAYAVFLDPRLYWIPSSIPFLKLGVTEYDPAFRVSSLSALAEALLAEVMERLDEINRIRQDNARILTAALASHPRFRIPRPAKDSQSIYIRLPLVAVDEATRSEALQKLRAAGIAASPFYPSAICDIRGIAEHMASPHFHQPSAESLARRLLTLPTHPLVSAQDRNRMVEVLRSVQRDG